MPAEGYEDLLGESPRSIAGWLDDALCEDLSVTDKRRWKSDDHEALLYVALLERSANRGYLAEAVSEDRRPLLIGEIATFQSALPFAEAERRLIADELDRHRGVDTFRETVIRGVHRQKICVEGIVRATSGSDLMERWWPWRRGIGDYEGGVGLNTARAAISTAFEHLRES